MKNMIFISLMAFVTGFSSCSDKKEQNFFPEEWGKPVAVTSGNVVDHYVLVLPDGRTELVTLNRDLISVGNWQSVEKPKAKARGFFPEKWGKPVAVTSGEKEIYNVIFIKPNWQIDTTLRFSFDRDLIPVSKWQSEKPEVEAEFNYEDLKEAAKAFFENNKFEIVEFCPISGRTYRKPLASRTSNFSPIITDWEAI